MLRIFTIVIILICAQALPSNLEWTNRNHDIPQRYNTERRTARDGYLSESHDVITADGYILEINRIPHGRFQFGTNRPESKPVVFLMHGLQSSALSFITLGPGVALGYVLADAGYDVWLANARGVTNSRRHLWLDPDEDRLEFFDYTYDDIATKDLPAIIDYVLQVTQQPQLNYIGHSQGGTVFLVLNSLVPKYNKKFISAHLLGAAGYQEYFPSEFLGAVASNTDVIFVFAQKTGAVELLGPSATASANSETDKCSETKYSTACAIESVISIMKGLIGPLEMLSSASIKQYAHFGQNVRDKEFRRWSYNPLKNLWTYGSWTPPTYDLGLIKADVTMHYTVGDILVHEKDSLNMAADIPNAKVRKVGRDSFSHFDFVSAPDSKELVVDYIVEKLNEINK